MVSMVKRGDSHLVMCEAKGGRDVRAWGQCFALAMPRLAGGYDGKCLLMLVQGVHSSISICQCIIGQTVIPRAMQAGRRGDYLVVALWRGSHGWS